MKPARASRRDYDAITARLRGVSPAGTPHEVAMQKVVDGLWDGMRNTGVSWVGFYVPRRDGAGLDLGPHCDRPACTPIGLHGVCGRCLRQREALVVEDVRNLGDDYVACDPRDRSEAVVPLFASDGTVRAVLDLDSHDAGAFEPRDLDGLRRVLAAVFGQAAVSPDSAGQPGGHPSCSR